MRHSVEENCCGCFFFFGTPCSRVVMMMIKVMMMITSTWQVAMVEILQRRWLRWRGIRPAHSASPWPSQPGGQRSRFTAILGSAEDRVQSLAYNSQHLTTRHGHLTVSSRRFPGFPRLLESPGESWIFFSKIPGLGKSWKLKLKVRQNLGKISLKVVHFSSGSNGRQAAIAPSLCWLLLT